MAAEGAKRGGKTVAITGAGGFVGRRLTSALASAHPDWLIDAPAAEGDGIAVDVTDAGAVDAWIAAAQPDMVVHLAAIAAVTAALKDPRLAWKVNLEGTLNVVEAIRRHAPQAHLLFVSSAEVYGESLNTGEPVGETALLQPVNPYAASKAAADILVRQAAFAGQSATVMRPFNHTGPGQSEAFVVPNFAAQIARIEAGLAPPVIEVGSLDEERDFLDVDDVIDAYGLVLDRREGLAPGTVLNVASGVAIRIGDILDNLLSRATLKIDVRVDPDRLRPASVPRVIGHADQLRSLGWRPRRSIDDTLAAVLDHSRRSTCGSALGGEDQRG